MSENKISSEKSLIEKLNKIVDLPDPEIIPLLRMKHISHLDLDGYSSVILSEILQEYFPEKAMTLESVNILPNKLSGELEKTLQNIENYDLVVITDLAINQTVVDLVRNHPQGFKVLVFDHHLCEIEDLPENFVVTEKSPLHPDKLTCATELYFNFIRNDKVYGLIYEPIIKNAISYFVECVRVYDTFEFWDSRNENINNLLMTHYDAPRLNTLFHILERGEFKDYIKHCIGLSMKYINSTSLPLDFLTSSSPEYPWISKVLDLEQNKNTKYVESAIKRMVKTPFEYSVYKDEKIYNMKYNIGVVFAEKSSPVIANTILERNDDIDFCAVVSNNQVSIYTNKENVNVSTIAKIFGGGGHKEAAGFTIPYMNSAIFNMEHFEKIILCAGNLSDHENNNPKKKYQFEDQDVSDTH